MPHQLVSFLFVVAVLTVTPGPDMALVLRNGIAAGRGAAWLTGLGCCVGISVHAIAAILGLSALLAASALAFTVVKFVGAAYLVYLGLRILFSSQKSAPAPQRNGSAFTQGLISNVLNPKIALLFLTLLPQFVSPGEPRVPTSILLAAVFLGIAFVWWSLFAVAVGFAGRFFARAAVRRTVESVSGVVLVALGIRVAFD